MIGCPQAPLRGGGRRVSRPVIYPRGGAGRAVRYSRAGRRAAAAATAYSATESSVLQGREYRYVSTGARRHSAVRFGTVRSATPLAAAVAFSLPPPLLPFAVPCRPLPSRVALCRPVSLRRFRCLRCFGPLRRRCRAPLRDTVIGCGGSSRPLPPLAAPCHPLPPLCRPLLLRRFRCLRCLSLLRCRCRAHSPRRRYRLRWRSRPFATPAFATPALAALCCPLLPLAAPCRPLSPRVAAPIPVPPMFRPAAVSLSDALFAAVDAAGAYRSAKMRINLHFLSLNRIFAPRNTESGTGVVNNAVSGRIWRKTYLRIGEYRCVCASPQDDERRARGNGIPPQMFGRYIFGRRRRNVCLRNLRSHSFRSLADRD